MSVRSKGTPAASRNKDWSSTRKLPPSKGAAASTSNSRSGAKTSRRLPPRWRARRDRQTGGQTIGLRGDHP